MSASLMLEPAGPEESCFCSFRCPAESALTLLSADCAVPPSARHLNHNWMYLSLYVNHNMNERGFASANTPEYSPG